MVAFFIGCANGVSPIKDYNTPSCCKQFHADVDFTTDERIEIDQYVKYLIAAIDAPILPIIYDLPHPSNTRIGFDSTCRYCIVRDPATPGGLCVNKSDEFGWYSVIGTGVGDGFTIPPKLVAKITAHEIMHSFAMDHVKGDPFALMNWEVENEDFTWHDADQKEWERVVAKYGKGVCK